MVATLSPGDRVTVLESASHPHLKGRVGVVEAVRAAEVYVSFRKTAKRLAERVWMEPREVRGTKCELRMGTAADVVTP